jgi:tetratricopeptide (TPR) repeat protein
MAKNVFISSTSLDLKEYRQAAIDACRNLGFEPIAMENFEAMGVGATEGSKRKLKEADLYIGIIAHRYGYVEAGYDRSVTEVEFDYAGERGLDRLCFLVHPDCDWPDEAIDHANADRIQAFKAKIEKSVIRSLFTTVDDFRQKLVQALVNWQEWRAARSGELDAIFATMPDDVPGKPEALIGREDLVTEVNNLLDKGKRVLLQGFGGMGKTALAAAITAERIALNKGPALWLRAGTEDRDGLFIAMARPFNAGPNVAKESGIANQARVIRLMLMEKGVRLIVLDDVWNSKALNQILNVNAIPSGLPVLVTSRHRFPGLTRLDVGRLNRKAALALLSHYGDPDWTEDPDADLLCENLGDHAFAVRVAGLTLALDDMTPGELLARIGSAPHKLQVPEGTEEEGRASIEELLNASLYTLDGEAQEVFLAFGAFFTASATVEMLSLYMGWDEQEVEDALNRLQRRGLAERVSETEERNVEFRIHDLAYSYAKSQAADEQRHKALDACIAYLERYKEPVADNFAALRSELDNFSGAVNWAMTVERYQDVEFFADCLYRGFSAGADEGFLHLQGYATMATNLLFQAAAAAEAMNDPARQASYLGNLGSAYRDLGQVKTGMKYYRLALKIYRDIGDHAGEGVTLGRIGIAHRLLGQANQAIENLEQALAISRQVEDERSEGRNLANLGIAYRLLGDLDKCVAYLEQALHIARAWGDKRGEAINMGNIGDAYRDMGKREEAIDYYQQALAIARQMNDRRGDEINLGRLGDAYREEKQYDLAIEHLEQALNIARETGDKRGEAINLGRLGDTYRDQGKLEQAVAYHERSLAIARQMDDKRGEGYSLVNLGNAYRDLRQYRKATTFFRNARDIFDSLGLKHQVAIANQYLNEVKAEQARK